MEFPKLPTRYEDNVTAELLRLYSPERISIDPILQALDKMKIWAVKQKFSKVEINSSFRVLAQELHPDKNLDKSLEERRRRALYFGKVVETYRNIIDLQTRAQIPFKITDSYSEVNPVKLWQHVLECIFPIPIWYVTAEIKEMKRGSEIESASGKYYENILNNPDTIIKNLTDIENIREYIDGLKNETLNKDLEDIEYCLCYGFSHPQPYLPEEWPRCPHVVSIKHLERAGAFDAPPNEWVVVDKHLVHQRGYIEGTEIYEERFGVSISCIPIDKIREIMSIEPSTVTMNTKNGGMFVVQNPYHKYLIQKGEILVPIEKYVDSKTTELAPLDDRKLPIPTKEGSFISLEDKFEERYGENYLPWAHLSPESVKILRDWPLKKLPTRGKELPDI